MTNSTSDQILGLFRVILGIAIILRYSPPMFTLVWWVAGILVIDGYLIIILSMEHKRCENG